MSTIYIQVCPRVYNCFLPIKNTKCTVSNMQRQLKLANISITDVYMELVH